MAFAFYGNFCKCVKRGRNKRANYMGATKFKFQIIYSRKHMYITLSMKLLEQFKDTLPYMQSEYCRKQQYSFCNWLLRVMMYGKINDVNLEVIDKILK